jgi:hypothetical protein
MHLATGPCGQLEERTQGNCGAWKKLATAGRKTTHHAGVAQHKGQIVKKNQTRNNIARGALRGWTFWKKRRVNLEGSTGVRDPSTRRQLHLGNEDSRPNLQEDLQTGNFYLYN